MLINIMFVLMDVPHSLNHLDHFKHYVDIIVMGVLNTYKISSRVGMEKVNIMVLDLASNMLYDNIK